MNRKIDKGAAKELGLEVPPAVITNSNLVGCITGISAGYLRSLHRASAGGGNVLVPSG